MKKFNKTFDEVFSYDNLYNSYIKCLKGVKWKSSVQIYERNALTKLYQTYIELQNDTFKSGKFHEFDVMERGKIRHIKSVNIYERVVQRCLCDYCLIPALSSKFIYDNSACIKGKGVHFAYNRLKKQLSKCSQNDYMLQFDFSKYFDTIPHDKLLYKISKIITDEKLMQFISKLVNDFDGTCGLGLGSGISQICALYYPSYIDHYFSCDKNIKAYGRYMDDGYIICSSKEYLRHCLSDLDSLSCGMGIKLNNKKTNIIKLSNKFVFLKARFYLNKDNKVIIKPNKKNMSRNRRKVKILNSMVSNGSFEIDKYNKVIDSIIGNIGHFRCHFYLEEIRKYKVNG